MAGMGLTYRAPASVAAGAVAPTAAQVKFLDMVVCDVAAGAAATDDATDVVHNFNLSADGLNNRPVFWFTLLTGGATPFPSVAVKDANTLTVTALAKGATCAFTIRLYIWRPGPVAEMRQ